MFYKKILKADQNDENDENAEYDDNAFEIYKSPSININTLTLKNPEETFHIMSKSKGGDRWVACKKENLKNTCVFYETDKDSKFVSSYYNGIDTTLAMVEDYIDDYEEKKKKDKASITLKENDSDVTVASFFLSSFKQMKIVLKNLKKWFLSDDVESSMFYVNKFG